MMTLDEIRPTPRETEATADMPDQVAIGWIRAKRRADLGRAKTCTADQRPAWGQIDCPVHGIHFV